MSFEPANSVNSFLPPNIIIPDDWTEARLILTDYIVKAAEAVNAREIAQYQDVTVSTGENWFVSGDANKSRYGSRLVVDFGTLPNNTTTTVAHGISVSSNTVFTYIGGAASIPGTTYIPLPYPETGGSPVEVWVDATNVNIRTVSDYSAYTQSYVVLEWIEST